MNQGSLLNDLMQDSVYFNHLLLKDWFDLETPAFHKEVYKPLMDDGVKLLVVKMPRGFAKTTILQGYLTQQVVNLKHPVIIYIGDTYTQAETHTETVRAELESNDGLIELYGEQPGRKWTAQHWTTKAGITVIPKGSTQSIRGLKIGKHRPSLVVIDDPENDENTETVEQRNKLWKHIFAVVKPMLQAGNKKVKIVYLGTPIHEDCVLLRLIELLNKAPFCNDPSIKVVELGARDKYGDSIWPQLWSNERLDTEEELYAAAGQLDVFYREYLGEVIAAKDSEFPVDLVTYYDESELPDDLRTYAALDMAFSQNRSADYSSIIVVSTSVKASGVFVRVAIRGRLKPDKFLDRIQEIHQAYLPLRWFVQNVVLDEFFKFYASEKMKNGEVCYIPFEKIKISRQANAKVRRISSLSPLYFSRRLRLLRRHTDLLSELGMHPRSKHDDLADPLASLIQQINIPAWTPKVISRFEPGTLEAIEEELRKKRRQSRYGLTYVPGYMRGQNYAT